MDERYYTLMLLNIHTDDWRNYCSLIHSPVPNVKQSTPALSTLLTLVAKYYSLSKTLPHTKQKWFSRRIVQFNTWNVADLQKWIRTATRIIHTDTLKKKTTLNNIKVSTTVRRYSHKIISPTDRKIIDKRKPTSILSFLNHPNDNRQHQASQDEYRNKTNNNKLNDRNQLSNEIDGKYNNNYGNTIINILKSNDKVNL